MMTKSQKIILCIVSAIAGLLFGSAIYYYNKVQARKQVFEQEAIEQKKENNVMEQKIDSIYKNFTSVDLKMADAKGFVHTIEYEYSGMYESMKCDSLLHILLTFDKNGNIIDIKTTFRGAETYTATYDRNSNGQIVSIGVRTSVVSPEGYYKGYLVRKLTYDSAGHICRIVFDDQSELEGFDTVSKDLKFSDYQENNGFMAHESKDIYAIEEAISKGKFNDVQHDSIGNWIARKGSMTIRITYLDDSNTHKIRDSRKITYYNKDEIDFTSFLN